jgi:hypothetical protein
MKRIGIIVGIVWGLIFFLATPSWLAAQENRRTAGSQRQFSCGVRGRDELRLCS